MMTFFKSTLFVVGLLVAPYAVYADCGTCGTESKEGEHKHTSSESGAGHAYGVGSVVEDFSLTQASDGESKSLSSLAGEKGVALVFWNQDCPFVQEAQDRIAEFHNEYKDKGVTVVAVDAGTNNTGDKVKSHAESLPFPVLLNDDSKIAAKFGATRTPEVFLIDAENKVRYHGAFDNGKLQGENATRESYLKNAADALLTDGEVKVQTTKAFGCSLKYAEGVEALPRHTAESDEAKEDEKKA